MTSRRLPRVREIRDLIGTPDRDLSATERRLARCASVWDLRSLALRRVPRTVFDYVDGAAMSETSLRRSREAFRRVEFSPRVLRDVSHVDPSVRMLGARAALPFAFAPTGFTRMMHHAGEPAVAQVATDAGIPYALSTLGTTSIEELAREHPSTRLWFQLYVNRDRRVAEDLVHRASDSGYEALVLTVDAAVGGVRRREVRDGLTIPPHLSLRTMADIAGHPRWWANALTTRPLEFANLSRTDGTVGDLLSRVFDPSLTGSDLHWLREHWSGPLIVKGIQCVDDARMVADLGADAIVLSNHGGRQIDMGGSPLELLPEVVSTVGTRVEVYLDGGVMSGTDIVAALALGANGVLVGRAYLYGLMAAGALGARRAVEILEKEIRTTMQLLGTTDVDELRGLGARLRSR